MNKIKQLLTILSLAPVLCQAQTSTENYVMTETRLDANGTNTIKSVQYYNGLGYPTVSVANVGGSGQTAYSLTTYDAVGREECKYLPVSNDNSILYKTPDNVIAMHSDKTAFSKNNYDALGRVTSVELPGEKWKKNDKRNKSEYLANTDADKVLHYVANPNGKYSLVKPDDKTNPYQYYPANTLTKEVSIDADEKRVETFKDLLGNVILQRTVLDDKHDLDTYYVYDAVGQLCYVLPPLYQKNGKKAITAYEYRYDSKGRITKKFLPGAEYIQYWYDNADRIVAMQDGVMRKDNKYRFTFYDNLGRLVVQGLSDYLNIPNDTINIVAEFIGSGGIGDTGYNLSYNPISQAKSTTIEIVNYYDNYNFSKGKKASCFSGLNNTTKVSQIGNLTGSLILCSNGEYVSQVMEYDLKGNLVKTTSRELGGRTVVNTNTYTFTNNVASSNYDIDVKHEKHLSVNETFTYNKYNNKKEKMTLAISHGNAEGKNTISYVYDELGRLSNVTRPFTATRAKNVSYEYEVHGWLKSISTNSFKEDLFYADCPNNAYDCYNGNIGTMKWSNNNYDQNRGYQFVYDKANRLTDAIYGERTKLNNKENRYNEVLEYDENGNITRLQRRGLKMDNEYGKIDNLSLSYNGNQLSYVEEDAIKDLKNTSLEFKKENGSGYKYNENGSLIADKNRGIAYITYDYNNNPDSIFFTSGSVTKYVYSASGQKLRVVHHTAPLNLGKEWGVKPEFNKAQMLSSDSTDYLLGGSLVMKNGKVDKFLFEGGYCQAVPVYKYNTAPGPMNRYFSFEEEYVDDEVEPIHIADTFDFYYYNQDHLGNNREVVNASGTVTQVTNYYPFGAPYADATAVKGANLQPYKYNGKELDLMHGLNTYDYGARQHDPILCRWDRIDPLCEKYYSTSPYAYCLNNPIKYIDPDGRDTKYTEENGKQIITTTAVLVNRSSQAYTAEEMQDIRDRMVSEIQNRWSNDERNLEVRINLTVVDPNDTETLKELNSKEGNYLNVFEILDDNNFSNNDVARSEGSGLRSAFSVKAISALRNGTNTRTVAHEWGHLMGLGHENNENLMTQTSGLPENPTNPNNIERWQYDKVIKSAKETLGRWRGPKDIVINENGVIKTKNWKR